MWTTGSWVMIPSFSACWKTRRTLFWERPDLQSVLLAIEALFGPEAHQLLTTGRRDQKSFEVRTLSAWVSPSSCLRLVFVLFSLSDPHFPIPPGRTVPIVVRGLKYGRRTALPAIPQFTVAGLLQYSNLLMVCTTRDCRSCRRGGGAT